MMSAGHFDSTIQRLERRIGYTFTNRSLLRAAFTHVSYANEHRQDPPAHNERLEFLGDAILSAIIAEILFLRGKDPEGELTRLKNNLVNAQRLSELAGELELGSYLLLGRGEEQSGGRQRQGNLCNTLEALIGALYLDGGHQRVRTFIRHLYAGIIDELALGTTTAIEAKGMLQETVHKLGRSIPQYRIISESGPDHDKQYVVEVLIDGKPVAEGTGSSKKAAEAEAARLALAALPDVPGTK